jgi:hypothetical protein
MGACTKVLISHDKYFPGWAKSAVVKTYHISSDGSLCIDCGDVPATDPTKEGRQDAHLLDSNSKFA